MSLPSQASLHSDSRAQCLGDVDLIIMREVVTAINGGSSRACVVPKAAQPKKEHPGLLPNVCTVEFGTNAGAVSQRPRLRPSFLVTRGLHKYSNTSFNSKLCRSSTWLDTDARSRDSLMPRACLLWSPTWSLV